MLPFESIFEDPTKKKLSCSSFPTPSKLLVEISDSQEHICGRSIGLHGIRSSSRFRTSPSLGDHENPLSASNRTVSRLHSLSRDIEKSHILSRVSFDELCLSARSQKRVSIRSSSPSISCRSLSSSNFSRSSNSEKPISQDNPLPFDPNRPFIVGKAIISNHTHTSMSVPFTASKTIPHDEMNFPSGDYRRLSTYPWPMAKCLFSETCGEYVGSVPLISYHAPLLNDLLSEYSNAIFSPLPPSLLNTQHGEASNEIEVALSGVPRISFIDSDGNFSNACPIIYIYLPVENTCSLTSCHKEQNITIPNFLGVYPLSSTDEEGHWNDLCIRYRVISSERRLFSETPRILHESGSLRLVINTLMTGRTNLKIESWNMASIDPETMTPRRLNSLQCILNVLYHAKTEPINSRYMKWYSDNLCVSFNPSLDLGIVDGKQKMTSNLASLVRQTSKISPQLTTNVTPTTSSDLGNGNIAHSLPSSHRSVKQKSTPTNPSFLKVMPSVEELSDIYDLKAKQSTLYMEVQRRYREANNISAPSLNECLSVNAASKSRIIDFHLLLPNYLFIRHISPLDMRKLDIHRNFFAAIADQIDQLNDTSATGSEPNPVNHLLLINAQGVKRDKLVDGIRSSKIPTSQTKEHIQCFHSDLFMKLKDNPVSMGGHFPSLMRFQDLHNDLCSKFQMLYVIPEDGISGLSSFFEPIHWFEWRRWTELLQESLRFQDILGVELQLVVPEIIGRNELIQRILYEGSEVHTYIDSLLHLLDDIEKNLEAYEDGTFLAPFIIFIQKWSHGLENCFSESQTVVSPFSTISNRWIDVQWRLCFIVLRWALKLSNWSDLLQLPSRSLIESPKFSVELSRNFILFLCNGLLICSRAYRLQSRYSNAHHTILIALAAAKCFGIEDISLPMLELRLEEAQMRILCNEFIEARYIIEDVMSTVSIVYQATHPLYAVCLYLVSFTWLKEEKYSTALQCIDRAIALWRYLLSFSSLSNAVCIPSLSPLLNLESLYNSEYYLNSHYFNESTISFRLGESMLLSIYSLIKSGEIIHNDELTSQFTEVFRYFNLSSESLFLPFLQPDMNKIGKDDNLVSSHHSESVYLWNPLLIGFISKMLLELYYNEVVLPNILSVIMLRDVLHSLLVYFQTSSLYLQPILNDIPSMNLVTDSSAKYYQEQQNLWMSSEHWHHDIQMTFSILLWDFCMHLTAQAQHADSKRIEPLLYETVILLERTFGVQHTFVHRSKILRWWLLPPYKLCEERKEIFLLRDAIESCPNTENPYDRVLYALILSRSSDILDLNDSFEELCQYYQMTLSYPFVSVQFLLELENILLQLFFEKLIRTWERKYVLGSSLICGITTHKGYNNARTICDEVNEFFPNYLEKYNQLTLNQSIKKRKIWGRVLYNLSIISFINGIDKGTNEIEEAIKYLKEALRYYDSSNLSLPTLNQNCAQQCEKELESYLTSGISLLCARFFERRFIVSSLFFTLGTMNLFLLNNDEALHLLSRGLSILNSCGVKFLLSSVRFHICISWILFSNGNFGEALSFADTGNSILRQIKSTSSKFGNIKKHRCDIDWLISIIRYQIQQKGYFLVQYLNSPYSFISYL